MADTVKGVSFNGDFHVYNLEVDGKTVSVVDRDGNGTIDANDMPSVTILGDKKIQGLIRSFRGSLFGELKEARRLLADKNNVDTFPDWMRTKDGKVSLLDDDKDGNADKIRFTTAEGTFVTISAKEEEKCVSKQEVSTEFHQDIGDIAVFEGGERRYINVLAFEAGGLPMMGSSETSNCPDGQVEVKRIDPMRAGVEQYLDMFDDLI